MSFNKYKDGDRWGVEVWNDETGQHDDTVWFDTEKEADTFMEEE